MNRIGNNLVCTKSNKEIVEAFSTHNVEFMVLGGLAVSWHCSSRAADDMDLIVNPTNENSNKVFRALTSLDISCITHDSFAKPGIQVSLKRQHYADILTPAHNGLTFADIANGSIAGNLFNIPVHIPSIETLIRLKEHVIATMEEELQKHQQDIELLNNNA